MKRKLIIVPILAALFLSGCSQNNEPEIINGIDVPSQSQTTTAGTEAPEGGQATDIGTAESNVNVPDETFLIGLDNKGVSLSDIKKVTLQDGTEISGENLTLDMLDKDTFSKAECEGFCYLADPLGIAQNEIDNAGTFKAPDYTGSVDSDFNREFKRYNVGDKYGDLTIKKATVSFDAEAYNVPCFGWPDMLAGKDIDFPQVFYNDQYIEFEGEATLTGYMVVNQSSDYFPELEGVLNLVVDDKSNVLPIANAEISLGEEGGFFTNRQCTAYGVYGDDYARFVDEYAPIRLGNINDVPSDTSGLNTDYPHYTKVKVRIENLIMPVYEEMPSGVSYISADIKDLEILEQ